MYDARIGRWVAPDPYGQYASGYVGMGNMPHMGTDPDGGLFGINWSRVGAFFKGGNWYKLNHAYGGFVMGGGLIGGLGKLASRGLDFLATNEEIWLPLTKEILTKHIRDKECKACSDGELQEKVGKRFEESWNDYADKNLRDRNYSSDTHTVKGGDRNTKPDGWADSFEYSRKGTRKRHPRAAWFEVKAKSGTLYNSTDTGQIKGHIDNLARTHRNAVRGRSASLTLVTTDDVKISLSVRRTAALSGIKLNQLHAQYRMVGDVMEISYKHSLWNIFSFF